MTRRIFLKQVALAASLVPISSGVAASGSAMEPIPPTGDKLDPKLAKDWLARWEQNILGDARRRYCDTEMGEELGWLVSPFLNGFYYGYRATRDMKWVERLTDWADSWIKRSVNEPDGFVGWPKAGTGGAVSEDLYTDSLLGEAMVLRPLVLMADEIQKDAMLKDKFGAQAQAYLNLSGQVLNKWVARGCWRQVQSGGLWVVPEFGVDQKTGQWTEGYARRNANGLSNPANKQNHIARWLISMHEVTRQPGCKDRAEQWWRLLRSRMRTQQSGKYFVWNYWDPAGPWDYKPDGSTRHWVGVHPNGGYYEIDVEGIVDAFEHNLAFSREDIDRLIATNRDFMWNQQIIGARFQRIDAGQPDPRWKDSPGLLWTSLVPYDATLKKVFVANHNPAGWGALAATPWFIARNSA
jgi:hypothetical protein